MYTSVMFKEILFSISDNIYYLGYINLVISI